MNTRDVYVRVLAIIEFFLKNAAHLSLAELQNYDPSLEQLAKDVHNLAIILRALASGCEDESMAINAIQCCFHMERLAAAVRAEDDSELEQIFRSLELHTRVP